MIELRDYQARAVHGARVALRTAASVCVVAPTGAGKTVIGCEIVRAAIAGGRRVAWLAHRRELVAQARARLDGAGLVHGVDVGTVQSGALPRADVLVLDEAHHYVAREWHDTARSCGAQWTVGLTATPWRGDDAPLADMFGALVVAAQYPDLIAAGHLVPVDVWAPAAPEGGALALDPIEAWRRHAGDEQGFAFFDRVVAARDAAGAFTQAGYPAACIDGETPTAERDAILARFRAGEIRVLTNVYTMTEGVDVPAASVCLLARGCDGLGAYLQMVGRVMRAAPGKSRATLIDLVGASLVHGAPDAAREYHLDGDGASAASRRSLRQCLRCGFCWASGPSCPRCGWQAPAPTRAVREHDLERPVWRDPRRVLALRAERGWSWSFAAKLLGRPVVEASREDRDAEWARLRREAAERGYRPGYAGVRYKQAFGEWRS